MLRYQDLKVGMKLKVDDRFTCLEAGAVREVCKDERDRLFICCAEGHHLLDGQIDFVDHETLVGLELAETDERGETQ